MEEDKVITEQNYYDIEDVEIDIDGRGKMSIRELRKLGPEVIENLQDEIDKIVILPKGLTPAEKFKLNKKI